MQMVKIIDSCKCLQIYWVGQFFSYWHSKETSNNIHIKVKIHLCSFDKQSLIYKDNFDPKYRTLNLLKLTVSVWMAVLMKL